MTLKNSRTYKQAMTTLNFFVKTTGASAPSAAHIKLGLVLIKIWSYSRWLSKILLLLPLGPVPQFFSNQPDKSLEELKKSPEFAFGCLQALVSKLVERGELSRQACFILRN